MKLRGIVERTDTRAGRLLDLTVQALIVISLVSFSAETLPGLSEQAERTLRAIEVATVTAFSVEYLLRIAVAGRTFRYVFSFFGIIDLVAILPFYLTSGVDLRAIRAFRLIRLIRVLKLARYNSAVRRFYHAFRIAREEIVLFLGATCIFLFVAGVGIYHFENPLQPEAFASIFHSLWWAVVTLTTVGYGDIYPITAGGRIFTFFVLMIGLGVVSVPTGLVASALGEARRLERADESSQDSDA